MSGPAHSSARGGVPFGRYVIRRRLAQGGMGEVFLADQLGPLGPVRPVALKRMLPRFAKDPVAVKMFLEEMALAAQLNHPNIATTYDFGEVDGIYFMAMEYVEGLTLRQIVEELGPLPVQEAVTIAASIAQALDFAHQRKTRSGKSSPVVHRDVSPHNVMISSSGAVKLLDFGIARAELAVAGGRIDGKLAYAAPEQLSGSAPDRRDDLWGLGVVLYEILTGVLPFSAPNARAMLSLTTHSSPVPLEERRPEASRVGPIVRRALASNPDDRWPSAEELRAACAELGAASSARLADLVARSGGPQGEPSTSGATGTGMPVDGTGMSVDERPPTEPRTVVARPPRTPSAAIARVSIPVGPVSALESALDDATRPSAQALESAVSERTVRARPNPAVPRRHLAIAIGVALAFVILGITAAVQVRQPEPTHARATPLPATPLPATPPPAPPAPTIVAQDLPIEVPEPTEPPPSPSPSPRRPSPSPTPRKAALRSTPQPSIVADPPKEGLGLLSIRTVPWSRIALDGRELGTSPLLHHPTSAGRHVLVLEPGEGEHARRSIPLEIRAGEVTKVFVDFPRSTTRVEP